MQQVSIDQLTPEESSQVQSSQTKPQMFILMVGNELDTVGTVRFLIEFALIKDTRVSKITVMKKYKELQEFDNEIRLYFKDHKYLGAFPGNKILTKADQEYYDQRQSMFQQYFGSLIKIPGICIFPAFLSFFHLEVDIFSQG